MTERLSDEQVESHRKIHSLAHLGDPIALSLLTEVQASRKLVADLLALAPKNPVGLFDWYGGYDYGWNEALEDVRALIEASGCSAVTP